MSFLLRRHPLIRQPFITRSVSGFFFPSVACCIYFPQYCSILTAPHYSVQFPLTQSRSAGKGYFTLFPTQPRVACLSISRRSSTALIMSSSDDDMPLANGHHVNGGHKGVPSSHVLLSRSARSRSWHFLGVIESVLIRFTIKNPSETTLSIGRAKHLLTFSLLSKFPSLVEEDPEEP